MLKSGWLFAIPLLLASSLPAVQAASIRDEAGMFSPKAVREAEAKLNQIERSSRVSVLIETVEALPGGEKLSPDAKSRLIDELATQRLKDNRDQEMYILMSKNDHKISHVLTHKNLASRFPKDARLGIRDAFTNEFRKGDFDGGLLRGVDSISRSLTEHPAAGVPGRRAAAPAGGRPQPGASGVGSILILVLGVVVVMMILRGIGRLFGGGMNQGYGQGPMGGPGGMGRPGFGGPGYGPQGGGGGFMSSLFGGIGGAMAGNWLYDQFSGRHHSSNYQNHDASGQTPTDGYDPNGNDIIGANDDGGQGGDWGDGGGDWGGGGGDWGGGGGDWGGDGGGGGDW